MEQAYTYAKNIYYIQWNCHGYCMEWHGINKWKFYFTWITNFWRVRKMKGFNVIVIKINKPFWIKDN